MTSGVDPGPRGSLREAVLIKSLLHDEELEHVKFLSLISGMQLSSGNASTEQIKGFKELISTYGEIYSNKKKEREEFLKQSTKTFDDLLKKFNDIAKTNS